jgi:hypothetical protein
VRDGREFAVVGVGQVRHGQGVSPQMQQVEAATKVQELEEAVAARAGEVEALEQRLAELRTAAEGTEAERGEQLQWLQPGQAPGGVKPGARPGATQT